MVSKPCDVPERVIADTFHQPRPKRIGNDVVGAGPQLFVVTNSAVMETALPKRARGSGYVVDTMGASSFGGADDTTQMAIVNLQQPVEMIWHHHPGQGLHMAQIMSAFEFGDQ